MAKSEAQPVPESEKDYAYPTSTGTEPTRTTILRRKAKGMDAEAVAAREAKRVSIAAKKQGRKPKQVRESNSVRAQKARDLRTAKKAVRIIQAEREHMQETGAPDVDETVLSTLSAIGCSDREIAQFLGVSFESLMQHYSEVIENGRLRRNVAIKRKQYELAMEGNVTMLMWFGKQYMGQSDKNEVGISNPDGSFRNMGAGMAPQLIVNFIPPPPRPEEIGLEPVDTRVITGELKQ